MPFEFSNNEKTSGRLEGLNPGQTYNPVDGIEKKRSGKKEKKERGEVKIAKTQ